ncbi:MAG: methyltransferase domain-containing protein [Actinobacteria bacterium]|nr:methyltransferase domain-containing protein [Actinomycetota bacterium]
MDFVNRVVAWDGWRGRVMATVMAQGNADMENAAVELVNPKPDANIVMIGCGPGVGVVAGARRAPNGMVIGIDPSPVMVERTRTRCRRERVEQVTKVERAAAESLPVPDDSQDAVVSVNNIQLWNDRAVGLDECVRVLAPGGVVVVLLHTWAIPDAVPDDEWVAQLCADLSARDLRVEPPQTRRFRSGPAVVILGRSEV